MSLLSLAKTSKPWHIFFLRFKRWYFFDIVFMNIGSRSRNKKGGSRLCKHGKILSLYIWRSFCVDANTLSEKKRNIVEWSPILKKKKQAGNIWREKPFSAHLSISKYPFVKSPFAELRPHFDLKVVKLGQKSVLLILRHTFRIPKTSGLTSCYLVNGGAFNYKTLCPR